MARKNPTVGYAVPSQTKHEKMLSEMHSALYTLGDKVRKPMPRDGEKLLPKSLRTPSSPDVKDAESQIECLHKAFKTEAENG